MPADCRLIEAFDMRVDNATLTGESVPRGRDARPDLEPAHEVRDQQSNMVLAGTSVTAGEGLAVARRREVAGPSMDVNSALAQSVFVTRHRRVFEIAIHAESTRVAPNGDVLGDPMEVALVEMGRRALPSDARERFDFLPFSAERIRESSLHRDGDGFVLYAKGALQTILPRCTTVKTHDGCVPLDETWHRRCLEAETTMGHDGLRVLALAYRQLQQRLERDHLEESLTLAGRVGLEDPPRAEVPSALDQCRQAGIKVAMITGDHPETAQAIARAIGLVRSDAPTVVTGDTLKGLSDAELRFLIDRPEIIFARTSAEQKLRIGRTFQQAGAIVAVTGDGVNDAPALKAADAGVAMGISGTDVSRHAADIVLLDDNFASIVSAIEEGRGVFDNIRKSTTHVLT